MLVKYEHKSSRVKGIAFHPTRPWVLSSLHNGDIELLDYTMETVIDTYTEHEGPVRGIDFHQSQPLFVSGGDDYKIKVWNYQLKRCLFTLHGHLDYIRTVQFHHEYPWILSASDDQTIRIWNWQSRTCMQVITGHNHYVMSARFHPRDDLIVTASLDQTIRVWDISGLRKKNVSASSLPDTSMGPPSGPAGEFFNATGDVIVKYVLEGHTRGVNWASFHPRMPLIVSGSDDREVKIWRMSASKAWEVDTMRGHTNNVSCVTFHPTKDIIISDSEDKTIRVWDMSRQVPPECHRRDVDRYWIMAAHQNKNLLAAGHDTGIVVFKLYRERPPYDVHGQIFYYKNKQVLAYDPSSAKESALFSTSSNALEPRELQYNSLNPNQHNFLLVSNEDGGSYVLHTIGKGNDKRSSRGLGVSAVFVSRNRIAVLDETHQIYLKSLDNETKKRIPAVAGTDYLFSAGIGRVLCRSTDRMVLYDLQTKQVINEMITQSRFPVKYVMWSSDRKHVAMLSRSHVYIANAKFDDTCTINEHSRVKSGTWNAQGVFVYTTTTHIKYALPTGDFGIVRTLEDVVYLTGSEGNQVTFLDREGHIDTLEIDLTEALFKKALLSRDLDEVMRTVQSHLLIGESIIGYLQSKGYPDVALHFVEDPRTKFTLALQCGNLSTATECALELNVKECWDQLADEALSQGDHATVEMAYQKTQNFAKLSFLYLIVGNRDKLSKMVEIAKRRGDIMGRFHAALYLGAVEERVETLQEAGQHGLAYITAKTHGLDDAAGACMENMSNVDESLDNAVLPNAKLFTPPMPILQEKSWPKLEIKKGYFDDPFLEEDMPEAEAEDAEEQLEVDFQGWGDEEEEEQLPVAEAVVSEEEEVGGGWDEFGIGGDLPPASPLDAVTEQMKTLDTSFMMPTVGSAPEQTWPKSAHISDLVAAGSFDLAMQTLHSQLGIANFKVLKPYFMMIRNAVTLFTPLFPSMAPMSVTLGSSKAAPTVLTLANCVERLKVGYTSFMTGKDLETTEKQFREVLWIVPFLAIRDQEEADRVSEVLSVAREYTRALRIEQARRGSSDEVEQARLGALMTSCSLQPAHQMFGLRVAIQGSYKVKNYKLCGSFCRRFIEMSQAHKLPAKMAKSAEQVKQYLRMCDQKNTDNHDLSFDPRMEMQFCSASFQVIGFGEATEVCSFCRSVYAAAARDQLCSNCELSRVGATTTGSKWLHA